MDEDNDSIYEVRYRDGTLVYRGKDLQAAKEAHSIFYNLNAIASLYLIWLLIFRIALWPFRAVYRGFFAGVREFWRSLSGKNEWGSPL